MLSKKEKHLVFTLTILLILCIYAILINFLIDNNKQNKNDAYNAKPSYEEVVIDYMNVNDIGRDCQHMIIINRHYKSNKNTLVYCGQNTIDFRNIINFISIYEFESKQVETFTIYKWVYKGSYEIEVLYNDKQKSVRKYQEALCQ